MRSHINSLIFTTEKFPYASPGGRRICNLIESGVLNDKNSILVLITDYSQFEKIEYKFHKIKIFNFINKNKFNFVEKLLHYLPRIIRFYIFIFYLLNKYKINKIYLYSRIGIFTSFLALLSKIYKNQLIVDCTEWYRIDEIKGLFNKFCEVIHKHITIRLADKCFAIGFKMKQILLENFHNKDVNIIYPYPPMKIRNMINSLNKNQNLNLFNNKKLKTIFYAGSFKDSDDPIFLLNNILALSKEKKFKLIFISEDLKRNNLNSVIIDKVKKLKQSMLKDDFAIYGFLDDKNFFDKIMHSDILLLPRKNKGSSAFNQPMRLSEYAQFKKNILTSNVDEFYISEYDNVYIYNPSDSKSFQFKLKSLI